MTYFTSTKLINAQYTSRLERLHKPEQRESPEKALLLSITSFEDGITRKYFNGIGISMIAHDIRIQKNSQRKLLNVKRLLDQEENIGGLGNWEIEPKVSKAKWPNQLFKLFKLPLADQAPSIAQCVDLIHPHYRVDKKNHFIWLETIFKNLLHDVNIKGGLCTKQGG